MDQRILIGDNLTLMGQMLEESVDLIYADPPFNTGRDWGDYNDKWKDDDAYLDWLRPRLVQMHRLLTDTGSIYLHCDQHMSHYIKVEMDKIWGRTHFRNEIVWVRCDAKNNCTRSFPKVKDVLLVYSKTDRYTFNRQYTPLSDDYIKRFYVHSDGNGKYARSDLTAPNKGAYKRENLTAPGSDRFYEYAGSVPKTRGWAISIDKMKELDDAGLLHHPTSGKGLVMRKSYLSDSKGVPVSDLWSDIRFLSNLSSEKCDYATQKPMPLLMRIISASSNEGDLVLDPFVGSGTTVEAAYHLDRRAVGIDINPDTPAIARIDRLRDRLV